MKREACRFAQDPQAAIDQHYLEGQGDLVGNGNCYRLLRVHDSWYRIRELCGEWKRKWKLLCIYIYIYNSGLTV